MERKAMADGRESPLRETIPADLQEHMTHFGRGPCLVSRGQEYAEVDGGPCGPIQMHPCDCGVTFAYSPRYGWVWPKSHDLRLAMDRAEFNARTDDTQGFTGPSLKFWADLPADATEPEDRRQYDTRPPKTRDPRVIAMNDAFQMPSPEGAAFLVSICKLVGRPETNAKLEWELGPDEFIADGVKQARDFVAYAREKAVGAGTDGNVGTVAIGRLVDTIDKLAADFDHPDLAETIRKDMEEFFAMEEGTVQ
jgi:hypothetical protein